MCSLFVQNSAGIGIGNELLYGRWYECGTCCQIKENAGIWNVNKVAYDSYACWREGIEVEFIEFHDWYSDIC